MIKKIFFLFLFFRCTELFAQRFTPVIKTPINSFIENRDITWAAYAHSIQKFDSAFMHFLINQLKTGHLKASIPAEDGTVEEMAINYLPKRFIDSVLRLPEEEKSKALYLSEEKRNAGLSIDPRTSYPELHQIFYTKKGKVYAYIPSISLTKEIITTTGLHLGRGEILSVCINKKYNRKLKKRCLLIGSSDKKFLADSIPASDILKQQFNYNIAEALWPEVLKGKIQVYGIPENTLLSPAALNSGDFGLKQVVVPLYDEPGGLSGKKKLNIAVASSFSSIILKQNIYFDKRKKVFLNKIPEAILYQRDDTNTDKAVLRIVF